jgi:membrane protein insertase Oxa1/YidC/SpoIIIJ
MLQLFYDILISPVELFIEFIFSLFNRLLNGGSYGISIIGVSLAVSLLTLPLYKKADGLQEE